MEANNAGSRDIARESLTALDVLRTAKNAFFWLALIAIALHFIAWFGASSRGSDDAGALRQESETPGLTTPAGNESRRDDWPEPFTRAVESRLSLIAFVGRASVLVCAGAYVICLLVSLVGRVGGTVGFTKACIWSLAALAMVTPWVGADARQLTAFRSAFYAEDELFTIGDGLVSLIRFVLCPLLVIIFLVFAQLQFRTSHRRVSVPTTGRLSIHEV
ncbi:MAG TPA: hypothetical protein VNT79_13515 [Phycisphaerae bacterium]|nr:hypothetical protein [Phycisphaerae bacterium]